MVKFGWFFGRVAVLVEYFEQIGPDEIEGGARVEVRRVEKELVAGAAAAVSGFRVLPGFDCLTYRRGENVFALELCVDGSGRVVEAIDRRTYDRRIWSLRFDPGASTDRVDRAEVDSLLRRMGALS